MSKTTSLLSALLCTFIWGTTFIAQDTGMDNIGPFTFNAVRFFIGFLAITPLVFLFELKKYKSEFKSDIKTFINLTFLIGLSLFLGSALQQVALLYTDVANAAFFTIFYVPIVPIIIFLFKRTSIHWSVWPSVVLCLIGGYLLTNFYDATVRLGDSLVILGALFWSTHIIFTGIIVKKYDLPLTLGAAPTVTTGVVSALDRRLDVGNDAMNAAVTLFGLIQTDAPITRGSSGGALLNKDGELIGITTAIATADVGAEGLGFAIPINLALNIVEDLLDDGRVLHAFLGILGAQYFEVAEDGARVFSGVYIEELYGPSNDMYAIGKAGALPGDIIKKVNENSVKTLDQLITILRSMRAEDPITIEILRDGNSIVLEFQLDLRPSDI